MSKDIAAEIENEYGEITFKDPTISFGYNKIEITYKFGLYTKIFLLLSLIPLVSILIFLPLSFGGFLILIPFFWLASLAYSYYDYFDKFTIDFLNKELRIENKFSIVNRFRRLFKRTTLIPFQEVQHFMIDDGKPDYGFQGRSFTMHLRKTSLFVKPKYRLPIVLASFRFEREARRLGELLQFYVVGKPGIIE
jgi:hypothetical protein